MISSFARESAFALHVATLSQRGFQKSTSGDFRTHEFFFFKKRFVKFNFLNRKDGSRVAV